MARIAGRDDGRCLGGGIVVGVVGVAGWCGLSGEVAGGCGLSSGVKSGGGGDDLEKVI